MRGFLEASGRRLGHMERALALAAGVVVMLLMVLVCAEVLGRTALNQPIRGTIDMVSQMMAVVAAGGIAWCQSRFGNVRMTIFTNRLGGRARWLAEAFSLAVATWVVLALMRGSYAFFQRAWRGGSDTPELQIPTWIGIGFVTLALALLLARLVIQLLEALRLASNPTSASAIFSLTGGSAAGAPAREA